MKMLWRLSREAIRYRKLYIIAILSTLSLTALNLAAPKVLSAMTGIVERGIDEAGMRRIGVLTAILVGLYLLRILFRFLSSYLAHKAAWYLSATCGRRLMTSSSGCTSVISMINKPVT